MLFICVNCQKLPTGKNTQRQNTNNQINRINVWKYGNIPLSTKELNAKVECQIQIFQTLSSPAAAHLQTVCLSLFSGPRKRFFFPGFAYLGIVQQHTTLCLLRVNKIKDERRAATTSQNGPSKASVNQELQKTGGRMRCLMERAHCL